MSANFQQVTLLEIVEEYASEHDLIDSQEALSERFDEEVAPHVIEQYGENDLPAMREAFNNYADSLNKEGQLHDLQVSNYVYEGKYET